MQFTYNFLNLLGEVKSGSTVKAKYTWLADGSKLRVRDAGTTGFDYLGSLTYTSSSSGLALESAQFAGGVIRSGNSQEINYFITDHLGSVRAIVNSAGTAVEQNDYYAFGAKHVRSTYPKNDNRLDFNGKEEQTTGDLKYLDYGARMYDNTIGRWFNVDPLAEGYYAQSPFHYTGNNSVNLIDRNGMFYTDFVNGSTGDVFHYEDGIDQIMILNDSDYQDMFGLSLLDSWTESDSNLYFGIMGRGSILDMNSDLGMIIRVVYSEMYGLNASDMDRLVVAESIVNRRNAPSGLFKNESYSALLTPSQYNAMTTTAYKDPYAFINSMKTETPNWYFSRESQILNAFYNSISASYRTYNGIGTQQTNAIAYVSPPFTNTHFDGNRYYTNITDQITGLKGISGVWKLK